MESKKSSNNSPVHRRTFIGGLSAATIGLTVVPRHVLGGNGFTAPSDMINIAYIGCGTQGLREMPALLDILSCASRMCYRAIKNMQKI